MKKIICAICCLFAFTSLFGTLVGCGGGVKDTEDNLVIESYVGGYGTDFLYRLKDRFEEIYSGKTVQILTSESLMNPEFESKIKAGPANTPVDLYFGNAINFNNYVAKGSQVLMGYDNVLEDLSDVLDSPAYGESKNIREKILPEYLDYFTYEDGKAYSLPWAGGVDGLVYHTQMFEENGWKVPNTTDELVALADGMPEDYAAFIWPGSIGYWETVHYTWWAQYEGYDGYIDFYMAQTKDAQGNYTGNYTDAYFMQEGRYEALRVMEQLIYGSKNSYVGSITANHKIAQMSFMNSKNKIAMMPNGDWLENEMSEDYPVGSTDIAIMKTPVISSITDKTPSIVSAAESEGKTPDRKLSETIAAIDAGSPYTAVTGVTESDYEIIKDARSIVYSNGFNHDVMIPCYANAKNLAKDFLRLMLSEEGLRIFFETTGSMLPYESEYYREVMEGDSLTTFQRSKFEIFNNDPKFMTRRHSISKLFYLTGLQPYSIYAPETKIGGIGNDAVTAEKFIQSEIQWVKDNISGYFEAAGIKNPIITIQ